MSGAKRAVARSIRDRAACEAAAERIKRGEVAGTFIRGVCGLWIDGAHPEALDRVYEIKGEKRTGRPFGTTLNGAEFVQIVDADQVAGFARDIFTSPERLLQRLGSLCFIRAPVRRQFGSKLPASLVSRTDDGIYWLQNWLPEGCRTSQKWIEAITRHGIELPVATSMNVSGQPELVEQEAGADFCRRHGIPVFLRDPKSNVNVQGSFPIVQVDRGGIRLVREGHFPGRIFERLLEGWEVDLTDYQRAKYPLMEMPARLQSGSLTGTDLRLALLQLLDG